MCTLSPFRAPVQRRPLRRTTEKADKLDVFFSSLSMKRDTIRTNKIMPPFVGRPSMEAFFGHPREPLSGY